MEHRTAVGSAFVVGGAALVGAGVTMYKMLAPVQSCQGLLHWWLILPLILIVIGVLAIIAGLYILIAPLVGGKIQQLRMQRLQKKQRIEEQRRRTDEEAHWQLYGPEYTISEPTIDRNPMNPGEAYSRYRAKFKISIKNKCPSEPPLEVYFNSANMKLKQQFGRSTLSMYFMIEPRLPNSSIEPGDQQDYPISMVGRPESTAQPYLDLSQHYHWVISGIKLSLYGLGEEECHREGDANV